MKKIYIIAAVALVLVCCTKQVVAPVETEKSIDFSSYIGRELTKAENSLTTSGFKVSAYVTGNATAYFENVEFGWNSTKNRYVSETAKYWPASGTLDFYAVSPKAGISTKKVSYSGIDGLTDVCAAKATTQSYNSSGTALSFSHKLTKVAFKFTGDKLSGSGANSNLSYEIAEVKISALGTATYDISGDTWTTPNTSKSYDIKTTGGSAFKDTLNSSKATSNISAALYLIPGQPSTSSVTLSIKYQVKENGKIIDNAHHSTAATLDLSSSANSKWTIGTSLIYNVTLKPSSSASAITFSATTTDWDETKEIDPALIYGDTGLMGVKIGDLIWAPVNCGYHPTDYPCGKLYQWGRKDGQGYSDNITKVYTNVSDLSTIDSSTFYLSDENWYSGSSPAPNDLWGASKTEYDPCPNGWRVPTETELKSLGSRKWVKNTDITGTGTGTYQGAKFGTSPNTLFLPATGHRYGSDGSSGHPYWAVYFTSTTSGNRARAIDYEADEVEWGTYARASGLAVRCVKE